VRLLLVAGERVHGDVLASWRRSGGDAIPWFNLYGPTETSLISSEFELPAGAAPPAGDPPIGVAIDHTQLHIVDHRLQRVPRGVIGELCIGGRGVARGYLGLPALTACRFVPDPFGDHPGARLYRTGDLVRRRRDGSLDYLGRSDEQLKIRGVRVEPGEVEAAIRGHAAVRHAAVLVAGADEAARELVAYVAPREPGLSVEALRRHLQERLVSAMIPARWVLLETLPLNRSGKVDRSALPAPGPSAPPEAPPSSPPRTATEAALAAIWAELLGLPSVSRDANFFELGGHSMLAMQVAFLARKRMGVEIGLQAVMSAETLSELARSVEGQRRGRPGEGP
jgi:acyl-coenzyme A synthetase/AMP-(fatty) acid ligase/acyl carrier protein